MWREQVKETPTAPIDARLLLSPPSDRDRQPERRARSLHTRTQGARCFLTDALLTLNSAMASSGNLPASVVHHSDGRHDSARPGADAGHHHSQNDLAVLEQLKETIRRGQHEIYKPVPRPDKLLGLYLGSFGSHAPTHPEQPASAPPEQMYASQNPAFLPSHQPAPISRAASAASHDTIVISDDSSPPPPSQRTDSFHEILQGKDGSTDVDMDLVMSFLRCSEPC
jgi:hypothetical protein